MGSEMCIRDSIKAVDFHCSLAGGEIAGQDIHRRAFSSAVRPQKPENLPLLRVEADVVDRSVGTIALGKIFYFNHTASQAVRPLSADGLSFLLILTVRHLPQTRRIVCRSQFERQFKPIL